MLPQKVKTNITIFKVMAWITIILGTLGCIIAIVVGGIAASAIALDDNPGGMLAGGVSIIIGLIGVVFCVAFGILYLMIAKNLPLKKDWARILGIVLSVLMLFSFPIGTVLGIILLVNFFSDEFKQWWENA